MNNISIYLGQMRQAAVSSNSESLKSSCFFVEIVCNYGYRAIVAQFMQVHKTKMQSKIIKPTRKQYKTNIALQHALLYMAFYIFYKQRN